jgi:hypothetical protein
MRDYNRATSTRHVAFLHLASTEQRTFIMLHVQHQPKAAAGRDNTGTTKKKKTNECHQLEVDRASKQMECVKGEPEKGKESNHVTGKGRWTTTTRRTGSVGLHIIGNVSYAVFIGVSQSCAG